MSPVISKNDMKTVIVTNDRNFRRICVSFMNSIAFGAEKLAATSVMELETVLKSDKNALNVVFDGSLIPMPLLSGTIKNLELLAERDRLVILVCVSPEQQLEISKFEISKANIFFSTSAVKGTYNKAFHDFRNNSGKSTAKPIPQSNNQSDQNNEKKVNLIAVEASAHLKNTLEQIKNLKNNPEDFKSLEHIGQRFNGLIGSFAFLGPKVGWKQMRDQAQNIDHIAKYYARTKNSTEICAHHIDFIVAAAKCSFLILKDLRELVPVKDELLLESDKLNNLFDSFDDIQVRKTENQEDVDAIFEMALKQIS